MSVVEELEESREHQRFQVRYGAVAVLDYKSSVKAGLITDISRSGLSFRYLDHNPGKSKVTNWPSHELKISWNTRSYFYIDEIPCKVVADQPMPTKELYSYMPMRKCSVRFGEMTPWQISKVEHFIENFTKGPICESTKITAC